MRGSRREFVTNNNNMRPCNSCNLAQDSVTQSQDSLQPLQVSSVSVIKYYVTVNMITPVEEKLCFYFGYNFVPEFPVTDAYFTSRTFAIIP
jgi:hypothetical protein